MTTADTKPSAAGQQLMEQRLDALDRALLGILPRSERLALVTQVETRVRELTDSSGAVSSTAEIAAEPEVTLGAVVRRAAAEAPRRRSRLALSSGILGIVALAMLFAIPITYLVVMFIGEGLGEFVSIALLSIHMLVVAVGGLVALVMGIAGLVSLARRKGRLVGHGWAITGLCTAPLPTLVGGLMVLVTALSLFAVQAVVVPSAAPPQLATWGAPPPGPPTYCDSTQGSPYAPAPSYTPNIPLPLSVAPTFCPPGTALSPPPLPALPATGPAFNPTQIHWLSDIDQAVKQAKDENKQVLVHFYGDSCPPCRIIEQKVFSQPQVVQAIMQSYVPVKINVDKQEVTASRYAVRQIPTDLFLAGESGKETHRAVSKSSVAEYVNLLTVQATQTGRSSSTNDLGTLAEPALPPAPPIPSLPLAPSEPLPLGTQPLPSLPAPGGVEPPALR